MKWMCFPVVAAAIFAAAPAGAARHVEVVVDAAHPGPVINKNVYGQFVEHLGTGVYGGLWVGPESPIPNTRGWRNDVIGALKALHVPLVRWPGGCFADDYAWRDGIGPRDRRPVKINTNWGGVAETNAVGTHEFFDLVGLLGADAYVNGNVGTGSAGEVAEWVEYMTADGQSALARLRATNGHPAPFKVAFFGLGNESWGCGGNMTWRHYTDLYNHYATFVRARKEAMPALIAAGGLDGDVAWTDYLSRHIRANASAISLHYYTVPGRGGKAKGAATGFGEDQWMSALQDALHMDDLIAANVARLGATDPGGKFTLAVDEWGTWYDPTPGTIPRFLQQQNSLRDALVAALHFHIFHAHADRVSMANIAQMVNVLQAMVLTDGGRMVLTPTYHVFKMYVPFQDATALPVQVTGAPRYTLGATSIPPVSVTAARGRDGRLGLGLVNTDPHEAADVGVAVAGVRAVSATGSVLTAAAMDAHNTFAVPDAVAPAPLAARIADGKVIVRLPPKSVAVLAIGE